LHRFSFALLYMICIILHLQRYAFASIIFELFVIELLHTTAFLWTSI
jgi:hypothetical protein